MQTTTRPHFSPDERMMLSETSTPTPSALGVVLVSVDAPPERNVAAAATVTPPPPAAAPPADAPLFPAAALLLRSLIFARRAARAALPLNAFASFSSTPPPFSLASLSPPLCLAPPSSPFPSGSYECSATLLRAAMILCPSRLIGEENSRSVASHPRSWSWMRRQSESESDRRPEKTTAEATVAPSGGSGLRSLSPTPSSAAVSGRTS